jgi:hypothetical protein
MTAVFDEMHRAPVRTTSAKLKDGPAGYPERGFAAVAETGSTYRQHGVLAAMDRASGRNSVEASHDPLAADR